MKRLYVSMIIGLTLAGILASHSIPTVDRISVPEHTGSQSEEDADPEVRLGDGLWAATWSEVPQDFVWLTPMVWIRGNGVGDDSWTSNRYFQPEAVTAELATRPEGRRVLFPWRYRHALLNHPWDRLRASDGTMLPSQGPFANAAAMSITTEWTPFVNRMADLGARPDYLILDIESAGAFKSWNIDLDTIDDIIDDPRFTTTSIGENRTPAAMTGDWSASQIKSGDPIHATTNFNATIDRIFAQLMEKSILEPALERWPNLVSSNYGGIRVSPEEATPDMNGVPVWGDARFGTNSALEFYGRLRNIAKFFGPDPSDPMKVVRTGVDRFKASGWLGLQLDVNRSRAKWRTNPTPFHAWIATPDWHSDGFSRSYFENSPYWRENIFHQALGGASLILYWNPQRTDLDPEVEIETRIKNAEKLEDVLAELDSRTQGASPLIPLEAARLDWTKDFIIGGADLPNGRRLWRISVAPEVRSITVNVNGRIRRLQVEEEPGFWLTGEHGDVIEMIEIERD